MSSHFHLLTCWPPFSWSPVPLGCHLSIILFIRYCSWVVWTHLKQMLILCLESCCSDPHSILPFLIPIYPSIFRLLSCVSCQLLYTVLINTWTCQPLIIMLQTWSVFSKYLGFYLSYSGTNWFVCTWIYQVRTLIYLLLVSLTFPVLKCFQLNIIPKL